VLAVAAVYFLLPLLAAAEFSLRAPAAGTGSRTGSRSRATRCCSRRSVTSLQIAVVTAVLVLALVVPTAVWVRLQMPGLAGRWRARRSCRS
jgi:putative spermidine/putrescine transport system permease protein